MAIQFTVTVGLQGADVVRSTTAVDPTASQVVFLIQDTVQSAQFHQKSRIAESGIELADRFLNPTQYGFSQAAIKGLSKPIEGANGLATLRANVAAVPLTEVAVLCGTAVDQRDQVTHETINNLIETFLETDGMS